MGGLCPALACSNREPGILAVTLADRQECLSYFQAALARSYSLGFSGLMGASAERTPFTWVLRLKTLSPLQA